MTAPWLSILIPVYKVEAWLPACVESIVPQALRSGPGIEIVLLDDASPDGCPAWLDAAQARLPGLIRVVRHERNRGISASRNDLLDAARGDYLWFIDADDLMEPGALASLKAIVDAHAPDLVSCDFRSFEDSSGQPRKSGYAHVRSFAGPAGTLHGDRDALLRGFFSTGQFHPWSKIVRRRVWPQGLRFPEGRIFEDMAVYGRLLLWVQSHYHAPEVWIGYRQRSGSALSGMKAQHLGDWMAGLDGYANEMLVSGSHWNEGTRFVVSHYTARALLGTRRQARRLGQSMKDEMPQWRRASPLSARELTRAYLKRGQLLRALQWAWASRTA